MQTVDNPRMVGEIIARNGDALEPWERPVVRVVRYDNMWGHTAYGLVYEGDALDCYHASPACKNVRVLFDRS